MWSLDAMKEISLPSLSLSLSLSLLLISVASERLETYRNKLRIRICAVDI